MLVGAHIKKYSIFFLVILAGCTPVLIHQLDSQYGEADPARYVTPAAPLPGVPEYWRDIRPLLEQRCTVCHGCYDAPCQQNLASWDGIVRGANPELVYNLRLLPSDPTRLFVDASTSAEWREKKFHPTLNERVNTPEANLQGSLLYRLLDLKRNNPLPDNQVLDNETFTFSLNRKQSCPAIENMAAFEKEHPQWGMPYGLPAISEREFVTLEKWLEAGAPTAPLPAMPALIEKRVQEWEAFFNGDSMKQRLMSRYIYEHLFLGHLYFDEVKLEQGQNPLFFRLVRSSTPPGEPIREIATRRPYDDPGTSDFWYRLRREEGSVVEKTHMPYALNATRKQRWKEWFLDADYHVDQLPSYDSEMTGNPFIVFQPIPIDSRYRFMLDEARFSIDNFIKGPVCRGQVALGVIDDHFWVFFVDPDTLNDEATADFLAKESNNLRLPNESDSNTRVYQWFTYKHLQKKYLQAKAQFTQQSLVKSEPLTEKAIWDGDGGDNAALTVFRHSDSATVVKGLVGQAPKTAWVLGYPLLERIHYLLVAGFDVYGGLGHQMNTRLYMDFMRMEGEANFLDFLPMATRLSVRDYWYRDASNGVRDFVYGERFNLDVETGIHFKSKQYQLELYDLFARRTHAMSYASAPSLQQVDKRLLKPLARLQGIKGDGLAHVPQSSILRVDGSRSGSEYFTLVNNSGYSNNSELFGDARRRLPAEDYLTVVPGILGAYPNAYFRVDIKNLGVFANRLAVIRSPEDYAALVNDYAVRRSSAQFWAFSDQLHAYYRQREPINAGMLDYNRLENR